MKYIATLTALFLLSCSTSAQSKSDSPRQLREGIYLKAGSEISKDYTRCQLVQIKRTMQGQRHLFIADNGDTLYRTFQKRLLVDSCYHVYNVKNK